jgi:hypothetical protein
VSAELNEDDWVSSSSCKERYHRVLGTKGIYRVAETQEGSTFVLLKCAICGAEGRFPRIAVSPIGDIRIVLDALVASRQEISDTAKHLASLHQLRRELYDLKEDLMP